MPLTGSPPIYTRGYSFTTHSIDQPNVPQPGDKLDQEFDDIAVAVNDGNLVLQGITNPDGTLKDESVGVAQLEDGLFDVIVTEAAAALQPMVDLSADNAAASQTWASAAQGSAAAAAADAITAAGAITDSEAARDAAQAAAAAAGTDASEAQDWAEQAENSANSATASMQSSELARDKAFDWAEYLAGPVDPAPPGWPEAVDDGMWSAKWWAVRAQQIVGQFGNWYLGAYAIAPVIPSTGPWPAGTMYYDTTLGQMMVWSGTAWTVLAQPSLSTSMSFVYVATADQTVFSGPDQAGDTPAMDPGTPEPVDVHLNGVRLVRDDGSGFGDYTVNPATSTLTLKEPVVAGSIVQWDLLVEPSSVAPVGAVLAHKINDVSAGFNGVAVTFPLVYNDGAGDTPATPGSGVQLAVVLDGVPQEAGADFTSAGSNLTFTQPPPAGTRFWSVWYQAG